MIRLKTKLALFNLLSKLAFTALFLLFLPFIVERVNLRQVDNSLIQKREQVIGLIASVGIEPFITSDSTDAFGSYNILKEEFISLERIGTGEYQNYVEIARRLIEDEEIDYRVLNYSFLVDGKMYLLEIGKSLASIRDARRNITKVILAFLGIIIVLTLLTDLRYTSILLSPLEKITRKLKKISDPSGFDKIPVRTTTADFLSLDKALIDLMEHIGELFQKEKEITVNISHELMTPVSVLRSKLENLLLEPRIDDDISARIEDSLQTQHRLQTLVNSLLLIARIESHQYLREDNFSVHDVMNEIISELKPVADDKGVEISMDSRHEHILRGANRSLVFSMFYNILNNSLKNTPSGGSVRIKGEDRDGFYSLAIADTGRGMADSQRANLFSRCKSWDGNDKGGTGIGLAIAKTIADFHDIGISCTSEIGKGTIFSFSFPENS